MKRLSIVFVATIATLFSGCANHYRDTALYSSSGRAKPLIAVLPVIDSTDKKPYNWDLSQEFTTEIRKHVADSSRLYLLNVGGATSISAALNTPHVDEIPDTLLDALAPAEFVLVSEVIDERITPVGLKNANASRPHLADTGTKISLAIRLRVIDLRGKEPKIALQEVIYEDHDVSKAYSTGDHNKCPWGDVKYGLTPIGMAHSKAIRKLVAHVEGYVGL